MFVHIIFDLMTFALNKDVVFMIALRLRGRDINAIGRTCRVMRNFLLDNEEFWKRYIIENWSSKFYKSYLGIGPHEISWKALIAENNNLADYIIDFSICVKLCSYHVKKRLELPSSSKRYLRFFAEILTSHPTKGALSPVLLQGNPDCEDAGLTINYTFKDGAFLLWKGEGGYTSTINYYVVDRMSTNVKVPLSNNMYNALHVKFQPTMLGRNNYRFIGVIVHGDSEFYTSEVTRRYNYSDSHGVYRNGTALNGVGSTTSTVEMPFVRAEAYTNCKIRMDVIEMYKRFILFES